MDDRSLLDPKTADNVFLVTKDDFNTVTNIIFNSSDLTLLESGTVSNTNEIEFSAIYELTDAKANLQIEFDALDSLLNSRDTFTGRGQGTNSLLHWWQHWANQRRYIMVEAIILKTGMVRITFREILLTGTENNSFLVTHADFDNVTDSIFDSTHFSRVQGGRSVGRNDVMFTAAYHPNDPKADLHFDFSAWESLLISKDSLTEHFKGGRQGLYWQQSWTNTKRFIVIEAGALRNGYVQLCYREILRYRY